MMILLAAVNTIPAYGQKMDQPQDAEVGDKVIYKWMKNNKPMTLEQEVTAVSGDRVQGVERLPGKEAEFAWTKSPLMLLKSLCMANAEPCTFEPGIEFIRLPLEKGQKWESKFYVKAPDFTAQVEREYNVEGTESVKVPAGEFQTFRVHYQSRYRGTTSKGAGFNGRDEGTVWYALSSKKLVVAKQEYKNSSGEKSIRELTSVSFK